MGLGPRVQKTYGWGSGGAAKKVSEGRQVFLESKRNEVWTSGRYDLKIAGKD